MFLKGNTAGWGKTIDPRNFTREYGGTGKVKRHYHIK